MKKIVSSFFMLFIAVNLFGQISQKELQGKWHIVSIKSGSTTLLDKYHPEAMVDFFMQQLRIEKPDYTKEDSMNAVQAVDKMIKQLSIFNIEFKADHTFCASQFTDQGLVSEEVECGKYSVDSKKGMVTMEEKSVSKKNQAKASIKKGILELDYIGEGQNMVMQFEKRK